MVNLIYLKSYIFIEVIKMQKTFNEIADFEPEKFTMQGEKTTIDNLLNKPVAFLDIRVSPSQFFEGDYAGIEVMNDLEERMWFRTSSAVLIKQLTDLKEKGKLPVKGKIVKIKRYYTIAKL